MLNLSELRFPLLDKETNDIHPGVLSKDISEIICAERLTFCKHPMSINSSFFLLFYVAHNTVHVLYCILYHCFALV